MQRLDLISPTFNATPFVIDLAERRLIWWDLPVGVGEHQVANLDRSSNRVLAHLLDLLEGRRMPLAHLLGLLADDVVEDPDEAQLVFGEGGILPWQTKRILAEMTGVPASTWEAIIARESNGQVDAYNPSGASGLFQTMPGWGSTATVDDQIQSAYSAYSAQGLSAWGY